MHSTLDILTRIHQSHDEMNFNQPLSISVHSKTITGTLRNLRKGMKDGIECNISTAVGEADPGDAEVVTRCISGPMTDICLTFC